MGSNKRNQFRIGKSGGGAPTRSGAGAVVLDQNDRSVRVNVGSLPAPDNVYDADAWWIEREAGHVAIYFGQFSGSNREQLRTRLKLKYPNEALLHHLWQHSRTYHADLVPVMTRYPADPLKVSVFDISKLPVHDNKEHSSWANFDAMSRTAGQAAIDFYHVAPPATVKFMKSRDARDLVPTPVVRVLLGLYQQFELLERIGVMIPEVLAMVPEDMRPLEEGSQEL